MWKSAWSVIARLAVAALLLAALAPAAAEAAVTKTFCLDGRSNGDGWSWELSGLGLPAQRVTTEGVPAGGSATDLARKWVNSINQAQGRPPAYRARFTRTGADGRGYFTVTASRDFTFKVGTCTITGNPEGCAFNPRVEEVSSTEVETSPFTARLIVIVVVIFGLVIIIIVIVVRRR